MRTRLLLAMVGLGLWGVVVAARLYHVQVAQHAMWAEKADKQQNDEVKLIPPRGTIYDRQGRLLAVSATVPSAIVERPRFEKPRAVVDAIAALGFERKDLERRFAEGRWSWIARQLEPPEVERLRALDIEGLTFVQESKRFYPLGELAGPVLGFVGVDHGGLAGLEAAYDHEVSGEAVMRPLVLDARSRQMVVPSVSFLDARPGEDLYLTIDAAVQYVVERELRKAMERHAPKAAAAILMDPFSGAVYAMASLPSFDPNRFAEFPPERWRNRAIQDTYEPGSTFKLITAAAALERNLIDPLDVIDCEMGAIRLERTRIRDHKSFGELSFGEVFAKSSNVGAIKVGLMVGPESFSKQIERFGFGLLTGVDLPGEAGGIVRPVPQWARHEVAYASIGQGLAVSPLQLVRAFAAVANGGRLPRPHVVARVGSRKRFEEDAAEGETILSAATVRTLVRMLESVVEGGTGRRASIAGYRIAGKTGTAQISEIGGYSPDRYIASFAGFAPSRLPRLVGVVTIFEPRGQYHGGEVAAPIFGAIMRQVLPLLGVPPSSPSSPPPLAHSGSRLADARDQQAPDGVIDRVRQQAAAGTMPDFTGLTARQALALGAELGLEIRLRGSGFVAEQRPGAGSPVAALPGLLELELMVGHAG